MRILLLNQAFHPDVVSSGQHLTDLAVSLAESGHDVTVIASASGYDNPKRRFRYHEKWKGIEIIRIRSIRFGKTNRWFRAIDFGTFLILCSTRLLTLNPFDVIVGMTSPPMISLLAALFARLRGGHFVFWVMDLNPDEAIAAGWLKRNSRTTRLLESILCFSLNNASQVVVLDRFMRDRVLARGVSPVKVTVLPPWAHDDAVKFDLHGRDEFRRNHHLADKFVLMYAGNHSPCHPLDTVLSAAYELRERREFAFVFVGGGSEVEKVRRFAAEHELTNIMQLPYQPLSAVGATLSAADLHVVVLGDPFVGIVHPCKIYNVLAVASPVLYIGPVASHVSDLALGLPNGTVHSHVHGNVNGVTTCIVDAFKNCDPNRPREILGVGYAKETLLPQLIAAITGSYGGQQSSAPALKGEDSWKTIQ